VIPEKKILDIGARTRQRTKHPAAAAQRGKKGPLWGGGALGKLNVHRRLPLPSAAHLFNYLKHLNYLQPSKRAERPAFSLRSLRSLRCVGEAPHYCTRDN